MSRQEKLIDWYQKELLKDRNEVDIHKQKLIKEILGINKEEIVPKKPERLTLWKRIKKVILG
jgi:hypothetical protein